MSKIIVDVALANLLEIRGSGARGVPKRDDVSASGRSLIQRTIATAARFLEALDGAGEGDLLRARAGLVAQETAAGTPYDESRREFIGLFKAEELPLPLLADDFGDLQDERHSYVTFPSALRVVQAQTADYRSLVPHLKATAACAKSLSLIPDLQADDQESKKGPRKQSAPVSAPLGTASHSPTVVAEAWSAQLHRVEVIAERELFWGCHLILLCHEARRSSRSDIAATSWLSQHLTRQRDEAMEAILNAAAAMAAGKGSQVSDQGGATLDNWHSPDFRAVKWFGTEYHFTPMQALCVECLWRAWERKLPGVSKDDLIKACDTSGTEIKDVFKGCKAWQKMIVSPNRGFYRLQPPTEAK